MRKKKSSAINDLAQKALSLHEYQAFQEACAR